jgi:nucleotide-binding universal stress UspA family protein
MLALMSTETNLVAVATDGSAGATLAVEWAASFARSLDAELLAIQVVAAPPSDGGELDAAAGNGATATDAAEPAELSDADRARLLQEL